MPAATVMDESSAAPVKSVVPYEHHPTGPRHQPQHSVSDYGDSEALSSFRPDTQERQHATEEFSRFDQGPLMDAPAFVPENDFEQGDNVTPMAPRYQGHGGGDYVTSQQVQPQPQLQREESQYATPLETLGPADDISEMTEPEENESEDAVVMDRWAQIRKNAAERAARASEEQSSRSRGQSVMTQGTEAASETSNEESKSSESLSH